MFISFLKRKTFIYPPDKCFFKLIKRILGFVPSNCEPYQLALVHKSISFTLFKDSGINNERLEYLGDAILDSIVAEYLFRKYPDKDEGFLTQLRSKIVNRENLNHISIKLGIPNLIRSKLNCDNHKSIYGDALEALIGALFVDRGYAKTRKIVLERIIRNHINVSKLQETENDFKSRIIEWGQKNKKEISFANFEEPADNTTLFVSHLIVVDEVFGRGRGSSKKEAEQNAARQALKAIEEE